MPSDNRAASLMDQMRQLNPRSPRQARTILRMLEQTKRDTNANDLDTRRALKLGIERMAEAQAVMKGLEPGTSAFSDLVRRAEAGEHTGGYKRLYLDPRIKGRSEHVKALLKAKSPGSKLLADLYNMYESKKEFG